MNRSHQNIYAQDFSIAFAFQGERGADGWAPFIPQPAPEWLLETGEKQPEPTEPCDPDECGHSCELDGQGGFQREVTLRNQDVMVYCSCEHHDVKALLS